MTESVVYYCVWHGFPVVVNSRAFYWTGDAWEEANLADVLYTSMVIGKHEFERRYPGLIAKLPANALHASPASPSAAE
jgi:hypothetical protein